MERVVKKLARTLTLAMISIVACYIPITSAQTNQWTTVTIPGLPSDVWPLSVWDNRSDDVFVLAVREGPSGTTGDSYVYHWDGLAWQLSLSLANEVGGKVFATASDDVFVVTYDTLVSVSRIHHFDGTTWVNQPLPSLPGGIYSIAGERGNVYALAGGPAVVIRYDGSTWQYNTTFNEFAHLVYISAGEIYGAQCWGDALWNGSVWGYYPHFDFCDLWDAWGMRDSSGALQLYAVGNNNFSNGIRVWKFTETSPGSMVGSWGSKYGTVLSDPPGYGYGDAGSAYAIWGSGPNDVYVGGRLGAWTDTNSGALYHFDGSSWGRVTAIGDTPVVRSISGSAANDVWVIGNNRQGDIPNPTTRIIHYGPVVLDVTIDIKPGSAPNSINPRSQGKIPVAILSDASFDATTVVLSSVHFGATGNEAAVVMSALEDVNHDGRMDMVMHFDTQQTGIACGATSATLTGSTSSGQEFKGVDSVATVGCK